METFIAHLERWASQRPLRFALLMTAFLFAVVFAVFTPAYQTNDDVVMSMIASGNGIGLAPDEHIVFSHVSIGLLLKKLYTWVPAFPWYGAYLFGVQFLAQAALLYAMLTWRYTRRHMQLFYLFFAVVGIHLLVTLQFTSVAFLAVESGAVVALTALGRRADDPGYRPHWMLAVGVGLMVLGSLVRLDSYYGAAAVVVPPAAWIVWRLSRHSTAGAKIWRPAIVAAVLTQVLVSGLQYAHERYYAADAGWRDFLEFNPVRVKFNDYHWVNYTRETRPVFDGVKWSANDHAMIDHFFFDDPEVFSADNLRTIASGYPWATAKVNWRNVGQCWSEILRDRSLWPLWLLLPIYVWLARERRAMLGGLVLATGAIVGLMLCLMLLKAPPARVYYPLFAFQLLISLFLLRIGSAATCGTDFQSVPNTEPIGKSNLQVTPARRLSYYLLGMAALASAVAGASFGDYRDYRFGRAARQTNLAVKAAFAKVAPRDDELLVCWGVCFPFEAILPWDSPRVLGPAHLLSLGWTQQSPVNRAMKERFQITDLSRALYTDPKLYFVSDDELNDIYTMFVREHEQAELQWVKCFDCRQFSLWKPSPASKLSELQETTDNETAIGWTAGRHR